MTIRRALYFLALTGVLAAALSGAHAQDALKIAIGQQEAWAQQPPLLGSKVGIFKKHGIVLENFATQGGGETLQAVISGAADVGIGIGTVGAMRAFAKGAPIRIVSASFTGAGDLYWYVKADSPIKSLKDATAQHTISYSTNGASTHTTVLAFVSELGAKARPTATGGMPATLTQVMSGQIDIGWALPPFGLREIQEGKIRVIANGNDVPALREQTVRVEVANADTLNKRKDVMIRFMTAFRETLDWMFTDPQAAKLYAADIKSSDDMVKLAIEKFQTREAKQMDRIVGVDALMADGVKTKQLDRLLTKDELTELIQIPIR